MITNIVLLCVLVLSVFMTIIAMWMMYQYNIYCLAGLVQNPDEKKRRRIERAREFMISCGSSTRACRAAVTGIEVFGTISVLLLIVLCVRWLS